MRLIITLVIAIFFCSSCKNTVSKISSPVPFKLQPGDLLFQDSDCGPFCTSIEKVTFGYKGSKLSHVGLVVDTNNQVTIIEAVSAGVVTTHIDTFLKRSYDAHGHSKVLVGRLVSDKMNIIPEAIDYANGKLGNAYDEVFDISNDKYYCSELLYYAFKVANDGEAIFELKPMTYKDPTTNETFPIWEQYFEEIGVEIPENKLGLNPGGMSKSDYIKVVYKYGKPEGYIE